MAQLTSVQTGVTGVAPLSPAMSVAADGRRIVFSTFTEGRYGVYSLDSEAGRSEDTGFNFLRVATLPPLERTENAIAEERERSRPGLPRASAFTRSDYRPRLSLSYVAPPTIAAGVGSYGSMVGGGTAIYASSPLQRCFRDIHVLTQHTLVAPATLELVGRVMLGVDADTSML